MRIYSTLSKYFTLVGIVLVVLSLTACGESASAATVEFPERELGNTSTTLGQQALRDYGCISCHSVPGIRGANAMVGPPLDDWAQRHYIAGTLANTPANLVLWIQYPQAVEPGTAMPNLDVTESDARNMAAYLYTLGAD